MSTLQQRRRKEGRGMRRQTIAEFVREHQITARAEYADRNPHMEDMGPGARHWRVTLRRPGRRHRLVVPFSQGSAHTAKPTAEDVLSCLASDAAGYANAGSFEDWCGEYGYDTDSRRALRTFKATERLAVRLQTFLGDGLYAALVWRTEGS